MPRDDKFEHLPIPTYDEAISSSRPSSSQSLRGPQEVSDDAERQGLLGRSAPQPRRNGNYHAPTVESARSSYESTYTSPAVSDDEDQEDEAELRRDMEQMEVADEDAERRAQQRARMRRNFQKRIASISNTFSNIHLPRLPEGWSIPSFTACFSPFRRTDDGNPAVSFSIIARIVVLLLVATLVYVLVVVRIWPSGRIMSGQRFEPQSVRDFLMRHVDSSKIHSHFKQISYDDHMAGTKGDYFLAEWVKKHFQSANFDEVTTEDFEVYLNYPKPDGRSVSITAPESLKWTAILEEDNIKDSEPTDGERHQAPAFHGHSKSGVASGPLVYANYGSRKDFDFLRDMNVDVNGTIVLVRQYGTQLDPALKVKAAADAGALGCLIYSDPAEDGFTRGATAPDGPWRPADSVQRGTVSYMPWVVGDVLSPGWASIPGAHSISAEESKGLPTIPSLPLSSRDAEVLLKALQNQGRGVPDEWKGGINTTYWTGDKATSPTVELRNEQDIAEKQPIRNVLGRIHGSESLRTAEAPVVYFGNHRDAWCFGGVDPGSGTAVFMEVVRVFGHLLANGWRPRRTIVFASWDGGAYNLIGSTEHVESRLYQLRQRGVAYINVDRGVYGNKFRASGSPVFTQSLANALSMVKDNGNETSLFTHWNEAESRLEALSGRSDYVPFQSLAGMSSLDLGFASDQDATSAARGHGGPAFPAHSCHDTLAWMEAHGDPGFAQHAQLAQVLSLLLHDVADAAVTPFDLRAYADALARYTAALQTALASHGDVDLSALRAAVDRLRLNADAFMQWEDEYAAARLVAPPGAGEARELAITRIARNMRLAELESRLLDVPDRQGRPGGALIGGPGQGPAGPDGDEDDGQEHSDGDADAPVPTPKRRRGGIPGREQFKHVVFGPRAWGTGGDDDDAAAVFPAVRDAMDEDDWEGVKTQVAVLAEVVAYAADRLMH